MDGPGADGEDRDASGALLLAQQLARASTLSASIDLALPAVAAVAGAQAVVFGLAGSEASGVRCWPPDPDWSQALRDELGRLWETGPLTELCRTLGLVGPFSFDSVPQLANWRDLAAQLLVAGQPIADVVYVPVAAAGKTICGYFACRVDRAFDPDEVARLGRLQPALAASHGRFLRGSEQSVPLTRRQREILHLMHAGLTARAIASRLRISESTVGKHLRQLYARLDTHDRVSTVREAQVRGLLDGAAGEPWQDTRIP